MSRDKKFGVTLFGFNKTDVNAYIERIIREFDQRLKEKDEEIAVLKSQNRDLSVRSNNLTKEIDDLSYDKDRIARALIQAQEKAENIITSAKASAEEEKKRLDGLLEEDRERIVDIKKDLKDLRENVIGLLSRYEAQLSTTIDNIRTDEVAGTTESYEENVDDSIQYNSISDNSDGGGFY